MTSEPTRRGAQFGVLATCLVAATACSGAVTTQALLTYVLPACGLVGVLAMTALTRGGLLARCGWAVTIALAVAQATNLTAGDVSGPVARATLLTGSGTGLAVALARAGRPAATALAVGGVVASALWLGAADEVAVAVAVVVGCLVVVLPSLVRAERREVSHRRRLLVPLVATFAVGVGVAADQLQDGLQDRPPVVFEAAQADSSIVPPGSDLPPPVTAEPREDPQPGSLPSPADGDKSVVPLVLAAVLAALVLGVVGRLAWVALRWRTLRRHLRRGDAVASTLGAWRWTLARLQAQGVTVPPSLAPDEVARGHVGLEAAPTAMEALRSLGGRATLAGFSATRAPAPAEAREAWALASDVITAQRDQATALARVRSRLR